MVTTPAPSRRPTVVEVAQRAGVSIASVSRVLNGKGGRVDTVERVRSAVDELGYVPDGTGRALKLGRTLQVALAVDDVANPVYTEMMRGVEAALRPRGGRLLVSSTGHDPADLLALVDGLSTGYADGLIISPLVRPDALMGALADTSVPVVLVGSPDPLGRFDSVTVDSTRGIALAFDHLVGQGLSRIALVNGPTVTAPAARRQQAYLQSCARHGLDPQVTECRGFTADDGSGAFTRMREDSLGLPDGVLAANDTLALGCARAAISAGVRIPDDLAVTGIDDIAFSRVFAPSLTTVSLKARRRGELAAQLLLARLEDPRRPVQTRSVRPTLLVRESSVRERRSRR